MTDLRIKENLSLEAVTMDLLLREDGTLDDREELASAVRVALGTDRLADLKEILPDPDSTDRRGWWADIDAETIWGGWPIGCRNWLLTRAKISDASSVEGSTLERARSYTREALLPFVEIGAASNVDARAYRNGIERIDVYAQVFRGPLEDIDLRYQLMWQPNPVLSESESDIPQQGPLPNPRRINVPRVNFSLTMTAPSVVATVSDETQILMLTFASTTV